MLATDKETIDALDKLYSDPGAWTQFAFARVGNEKENSPNPSLADTAYCWCLAGAFMKVHNSPHIRTGMPGLKVIADAIPIVVPKFNNEGYKEMDAVHLLVTFNDDMYTTFSTVKAVIEEAKRQLENPNG